MTDLATRTADAAGPTLAPGLFDPLRLRGLELRNRLWLSPMCQYSAVDGLVGDWHLAHLGGRASGGWGLIFTEATAVSARGRISAADAGIWNDAQRDAWARVVDFVHDRGTAIALQLGHAGRKASIGVPWSEQSGTIPPAQGGWGGLSVDDEAFPGFAAPEPATADDLARVVSDFADAAARGVAAGFDAIEILAGHGFLIHSFLSPLTNGRIDEYGWGGPTAVPSGALLLEQIGSAVRQVIPPTTPLLVRVSATDWLPGGLTLIESTALAKRLAALGVDLIDVSTGGLAPAEIPIGPGYQVEAAEQVKRGSGLPTAAVRLITDSLQADRILRSGAADAIAIGRAAIRDPYFALRAAHELGRHEAATWQPQYARGAWA